MRALFSNSVFRAFMPLLDLIIIFGTNIFCFYIFKDSLDNFYVNYFAFWNAFLYMAIIYLVLVRIYDLENPKDFSFLGIAYTVSQIILKLLLLMMAFFFLFGVSGYSRPILLLSSAMQILGITLWRLFLNRISKRNKLTGTNI